MFSVYKLPKELSYSISSTLLRRNLSTNVTPAPDKDGPKNTKKSSSKSYKYCIDHVKKYDRENYLAATWIEDPPIKRAVFALRAFNIELSQVRDLTTSLERAQIRFQFWNKLIEAIIARNNNVEGQHAEKFKAYRRHSPVCRELLDLFKFVHITPTMEDNLNDLIKSRMTSEILGYKLFATLADLETNCSKSNGSLYQLACDIALQFEEDTNNVMYPHIREAAYSLGIAHGISNIIRGLQHSALRDCCYVPHDLLTEFNLTSRNFIGKSFDAKAVIPVIRTLSNRCEILVKEVNSIQSSLPEQIQHILLPRIAIQAYLRRLRRSDYNLNESRLRSPDELLPLKLWLSRKFIFYNG